MTTKTAQQLIDELNASKAAVEWGLDNVWFADHEDESGDLDEESYLMEVYSKIVEYQEEYE